MTTIRRMAWLLTLATIAVALHRAGHGPLAPPTADLGQLLAWVDRRGAGVTALALLRLGAEVVAWYLLALSSAQVVALVVGSEPLARLSRTLATPSARRIVRTGLGVGLAAVTSMPVGVRASAGAAVPPSVELLVGAPGESDPAPDLSGEAGSATMRPFVAGQTGPGPVHPPGPGAGTATMTPHRPAPAEPVITPVADASNRPGLPATWTVEVGDSFWTIAHELLLDRAAGCGNPVEAGSLDIFWRTLIEVNRDRLVDPSDPSLLLPGQVLEVPVASNGRPDPTVC